MKVNTGKNGNLKIVKTAGFKFDGKSKDVNRHAGLSKTKKTKEGENLVKRRKPLALKHVRRMRNAVIALSCVFVGIISYIGVGFFKPAPIEELPAVNYATVCAEGVPMSGTPTDYTLVENVAFMNYVLQNQPYWSSEMSSTVNAFGFNQTVNTYKQYYDGVLISADVQQGVSSAAKQFCVVDGVVLWRSSANKNFNGMNTPWSTKDPEGLSIEDFKQQRGLPPSEFSVYVLNENTIKNANEYTTVDNGNGTYTMTLELNVGDVAGINAADFYYKQQMYVTGGLSDRPKITWTTVSYTFDSSWRILEFTINDSYNATMGFSVNCTSTTTTVFSYDEEKAKNDFYDDYFVHHVNDFVQAETPETNEPSALTYLAGAFGSVLSEGATFKVNFGLDKLDMNGVVHVGLENSKLNDVRVVLGDISVFTVTEEEKDTIVYVSDGNAKYKLNTNSLLKSSSDGEESSPINLETIMDQLTAGKFEVTEAGATLDTAIDILGIKANLHFDFLVGDNGISLDYVSAEIPVGSTTVKARLAFGTKDDIPPKPEDISGYTDVLNGGITLNTELAIDDFKLKGLVKIELIEGKLTAVYADFDEISVYYVENELYVTDGTVKYKVAIPQTSETNINIDTNSIITQIINNLGATDSAITTNATLDILKQTISIAVSLKLANGIGVGADVAALGHDIKANISLTAEEFEEPNLDGYTDILNGGITLNTELAIDDFKLKGLVKIELIEGKLTAVYADFDEISVYYVGNELYITDGTVKYKVAIPQSSGETNINIDTNSIITQIINNLGATDSAITTNATLDVLKQTISVAVALKLSNGIGVGADVAALGHDIKANISLTAEEFKEPNLDGYTDILNGGITLNTELAIDDFKLNGLVKIELTEGELTAVYADFDEISVYYVNDEIYITDGTVKYKVAIPQTSETNINIDTNSIITQIINNLGATDSAITTNATLDVLKQTISVAVALKLANGIGVGADVAALGHDIKANISLTAEEFKEPNLDGYTDILNGGITLNTELAIDDFKLNGLVKIELTEGELTAVYADFDEISVYYVGNELYITDGTVKYKVAIPQTDGALDLSGFDVEGLIKDIVFADGKISTNLKFNALGETLSAMLEVAFKGGISATANTTLFEKVVVISATLSNETEEFDLNGYTDILNEGITLDLGLTIDETGDIGDGKINLNGKVFIGFSESSFSEIRADFGDIAVYYEMQNKLLFVKVGTTKLKIDIDKFIKSDESVDLASLLPDDTSAMLIELLNNLVAELGEISTRADIGIMDAIVPISAKINLKNGISAELNLELVGIRANVSAKPTQDEVLPLDDDDRAEFIDVVNDIWGTVESLIGNTVSASVNGSVYAYESEEYSKYDDVKYTFSALLEYDYDGENAPVIIKTGNVNDDGARVGVKFSVDSEVYLHFSLDLIASSPLDKSLTLDVLVMDANPTTSSNGVTSGGYTKDGVLDVFVSVSTYAKTDKAYSPLKVYAPMDEIMTLLAMAGSVANLNTISVADNEDLNDAIKQIASVIDSLLIEKYIPNTKDQFSSLGASLIPQILGVSLQEYLEKIINSLTSSEGEETEADGTETPVETPVETPEKKFLLSDKYIKDIAVSENSLAITLDSALLFGGESSNDLVVVLKKAQLEGGAERLTNASISNLYFGNDNSSGLDLALNLGYDNIQRPDAESGLNGYMNFDGLDTLVQALINSATHETDGEAQYDLNHYYLLSGVVNATISVIGMNIGAEIDLNSIAVYINEDNSVSFDAHISYQGVQELNQVAINGDSEVFISFKGDRIIIKRIQYTYWKKSGLITSEVAYTPAAVEVRSMTMKEFTENLMDNISFIFNFGPVITDNISNSDSSENSGISFEGLDLGDCVKKVLAYYVSSETEEGASWTVALSGGLIEAFTGMTTTDIPVKFNADVNEDGSYTVKSLDILKTTMKLFGNAVTLNISGGLNYCNPNEQTAEDYVDTTVNLFDMKADIYSDYAVSDDYELSNGSYHARIDGACGSLVKLPLGVTASSNGALYMLDGYVSNGASVQFEDFVEENGVKYGLIRLNGDTAFTAVWVKAYTVSYLDENGNELYSVIYRENEVLNFGNTPTCPEREAHVSQWVSADGTPANGTVVTEDTSFSVEYKKMIKVTLGSTVDFNYTGYDGTYKNLVVGFEEGSDYALAQTTAVGYTFLGWWYDDNGSWRTITSIDEFVEAGSVTLEALWLKIDTLNCTTTKEEERASIFSTLYLNYHFEGEVAYHFEGNDSLTQSITCTQTTYRVYFNNGGGYSATDSHFNQSFDGFQGTLDKHTVRLKDSWGSAKFSHWNMVVTLSFELPDGSIWTAPQTSTYISGKY